MGPGWAEWPLVPQQEWNGTLPQHRLQAFSSAEGAPYVGSGSASHLFQPLLEEKSFIIKAMLLTKQVQVGSLRGRGEPGVPAWAADGSKHIPGDRGISPHRGPEIGLAPCQPQCYWELGCETRDFSVKGRVSGGSLPC